LTPRSGYINISLIRMSYTFLNPFTVRTFESKDKHLPDAHSRFNIYPPYDVKLVINYFTIVF